ncbi:bestrophin-like domain [Roseiarcus sp.]|uniref:bestrophin-like domain n=1 Tax=Roseiarcus sp. TaxID=1969460 RepID=UPI003F94B591
MSNALVSTVSIAVFALVLGAGRLGLWAHGKLPDEQKNDSARVVVGQVLGVVSMLLSVALGILVGQSYAFFQTQRTELETLSAQLVMLDLALAQFGPETKPGRDKLKEGFQATYETWWGSGGDIGRQASMAAAIAEIKSGKAYFAGLKAETEEQKRAVASAEALAGQIWQSSILIRAQTASPPVGAGVLVVLTIWAVVLFFGMGLFARSNALLLSAMSSGALCVALAIFLVLELGQPYTGVFRLPGEAWRMALETIDR